MIKTDKINRQTFLVQFKGALLNLNKSCAGSKSGFTIHTEQVALILYITCLIRQDHFQNDNKKMTSEIISLTFLMLYNESCYYDPSL